MKRNHFYGPIKIILNERYNNDLIIFSCLPTSSVSKMSTNRSMLTLFWVCTKHQGHRTSGTWPSWRAVSTNSSSISHGKWGSDKQFSDIYSTCILKFRNRAYWVFLITCSIFRWINRKDLEGRNIFTGGFLGLDNIGIFDRSKPLPTGTYSYRDNREAFKLIY